MAKLGFDLILLGAPAAGKDTQAEILLSQYDLMPVESGKYWRKMAARNDAIGQRLRKTFGRGHAAPVDLMKQFLVKQISGVHKNTDLIFIGNPRLKPEGQLLNKMLTERNRDYLVISITLPAKEIKLRSLRRRRDAQDWKYLENRIKMYRLQVTKTIQYFKELNKVKSVNGDQTIRQVAQDIRKILNDYSRSKRNSIAQGKRPYSG